MGWIEIEDMDFYAYHGCHAEEQIIGNHFTVTLSLNYPTEKAAASDDIGDALNYVEAYALVQQIMKEPSHLLEHVADHILRSLFDSFPQLIQAKVKVSKKNPPMGGKIRCVSVSMERTKNE